MRTYSTILQGSEAVESLALDFARGYDFSEDETEEANLNHSSYIDTVSGIMIYYNRAADYYFFSDKNIQND
jgi:hypothetical protein